MTKEQATAENILIASGLTFSRIRENGPAKLRVYTDSNNMCEVWVGSRGDWSKWAGLPRKMKTILAASGKLWNLEGHFESYKH